MRQLHYLCVLLLFMVWAAPLLRAQEPKDIGAREVKMPAEVDKVLRAGRGDVLLLQMNKLQKVAVFDIKTEKILGLIPLDGNDTLVAGTADSIILLARDKKVIQRWSLSTLEKTLTVALPLTEQIDALAAGYAGSSPVMIMTRKRPQFLDTTTLKLIQTEEGEDRGDWHPHPQYPIHVAASADGSTFGGWVPNVSPSGIRTLRLEGTRLSTKYEHESAGPVIPSADGSLLFTAKGVYSSDLKPLDRESRQPFNYLFVESLPITTASAGTPYKYAIKVLSKAGKVKFELASGPQGMTVTPAGVLRWNVPGDFNEVQTSIIVTITDDSKQSLFHAFTIHVNDQSQPAQR